VGAACASASAARCWIASAAGDGLVVMYAVATETSQPVWQDGHGPGTREVGVATQQASVGGTLMVCVETMMQSA
jgi:hypothetical protein